MLKYQTVKTFAALQSGETGLQPSRDAEPIDFNLDLLGFGPTFLLIVNLSANKYYFIQRVSSLFIRKFSDNFLLPNAQLYLHTIQMNTLQHTNSFTYRIYFLLVYH